MKCDHCDFIAKSKGGLTLHKKIHKQNIDTPIVTNIQHVQHIQPSFESIPVSKRFIDICCGIGGFHQALSSIGYSCVFASDIDVHCKDTYERNYKIKPVGDITSVDITSIPAFDILCAGFPCQPFSRAGKQLGFDDERGNIFFSICRIIQHHKPSYIILENVRNLASHDDGHTWTTIHTTLRDIGYTTYDKPFIVNAMDVGIPQNRDRVIILCQRIELGELSEKPELVSIKCKPLESFLEENVPSFLPVKETEVGMVWDSLLKCLITHNIEMPKFPLWTDWWDKEIALDDPFYIKYTNWINKNQHWFKKYNSVLLPWLTNARSNPLWTGAVRKLEWQAGTLRPDDSMKTVLWSLRGSGIRIKRPDYIPTIVAMNMTPIYGPQERYLTARELLRLQSFPDTFEFHPKHIHKQIGNAVNVEVIRRCALFLLHKKPIYSD
jgi:DNA (cytosine-5)-methyltransferase 1